MPGFDGTGPRGMGPLTGRGMGLCAVPYSRYHGNTLYAPFLPSYGYPVMYGYPRSYYFPKRGRGRW